MFHHNLDLMRFHSRLYSKYAILFRNFIVIFTRVIGVWNSISTQMRVTHHIKIWWERPISSEIYGHWKQLISTNMFFEIFAFSRPQNTPGSLFTWNARKKVNRQLHDLVPFVQFKKHEKLQTTKSNTPPWDFHVF